MATQPLQSPNAPQWCGVVIALCAALFAFWQIHVGRQIAAETYALGAFEKFLELKIQYAEAIIAPYSGDYTSKEQMQKSAIFDVLGTAGESLLDHFARREEYLGWRTAIRANLEDFCDLLLHPNMERQIDSFGAQFRQLVQEVRATNCRQVPGGAT